MQIVYHLGAHCTDGDQIIKCLSLNSAKLSEASIIVPDPTSYRARIRDTLKELKANLPGPEHEQMLLSEMGLSAPPERMILSHDTFLGYPVQAVAQDKIYPRIETRAQQLRALFPSAQVEFHIGLRNPATFLPAIFERASKQANFEEFLNGADPMKLRWSDAIRRLRVAVPDAPVAVWCNEDTPIIWHDLLRQIAGHDPKMQLEARDEFFGTIMGRSGLNRMKTYLEAHPPKTALQRRRITMAFLDKFARPDVIEQEIDLPGWTESYVDALTTLYDEDVAAVQSIPGVTLMMP
jgi:hypothetical protein